MEGAKAVWKEPKRCDDRCCHVLHLRSWGNPMGDDGGGRGWQTTPKESNFDDLDSKRLTQKDLGRRITLQFMV